MAIIPLTPEQIRAKQQTRAPVEEIKEIEEKPQAVEAIAPLELPEPDLIVKESTPSAEQSTPSAPLPGNAQGWKKKNRR